MRLEILPEFISAEEAAVLNNFVSDQISLGKFSEGMSSKHLNPENSQMVSRFNPNIVFPELVLDIQQRLCKLLELEAKDIHTLFHPTGVVVNCSFDGAQVIPHKDPTQDGKSLLRCNVISSSPTAGGDLLVEGQKIEVPELGIYFCLVSEQEHAVTKISSSKPRIVWQFGFNVDKNEWNNGKIGPAINSYFLTTN
jgi:hypothetical protein